MKGDRRTGTCFPVVCLPFLSGEFIADALAMNRHPFLSVWKNATRRAGSATSAAAHSRLSVHYKSFSANKYIRFVLRTKIIVNFVCYIQTHKKHDL